MISVWQHSAILSSRSVSFATKTGNFTIMQTYKSHPTITTISIINRACRIPIVFGLLLICQTLDLFKRVC